MQLSQCFSNSTTVIIALLSFTTLWRAVCKCLQTSWHISWKLQAAGTKRSQGFFLLLLLQHPVLPWPQFHLVIVSSFQPSTNVSGDNMFSLVICGCQGVTDQSLWLCDRVLVIDFTATGSNLSATSWRIHIFSKLPEVARLLPTGLWCDWSLTLVCL